MATTTSDIVSQAQGYLPSGSSVATVVIWVVSILAIGILVSVTVWLWLNSRRYARKIPISVEENGVLREIGSDSARVIRIDKGLATVWMLKKGKVPITPMIYTSKKLTYPAIRKADGELVNYQPALGEDGKVVIAKILPQNLRMANANIRRYFREIYKHDTFMQKYGGIIVYTGAIVLISLVFIYILSQVEKIVPPLQQVADTLSKALASVHCSSISANNSGQVVVAS